MTTIASDHKIGVTFVIQTVCKNVIEDQSLASIIASHKNFLPSTNVKPAPGSQHRILLYDARTERANWEEEDILPGALILGVED